MRLSISGEGFPSWPMTVCEATGHPGRGKTDEWEGAEPSPLGRAERSRTLTERGFCPEALPGEAIGLSRINEGAT